MVPISAGKVAAKGASRSLPVKLNTSLQALSPRRTPTSALFYQASTAPLLATCVWEDNAACILISQNPVNRDRSRHVDVKFHFVRERVRAGEIKFYKCWGPLNVANALTKSLPRPAFHKHASFMHGTRSSYWPFIDPGA